MEVLNEEEETSLETMDGESIASMDSNHVEIRKSRESIQSKRSEKVYSRFIRLNKMSLRPRMSGMRGISFLKHIYSTTNEDPSYYTERKHEEYKEFKYILKKISGIPFVIGYGFLLVWIISDLILSNQGGGLTFNQGTDKDVVKDICESITKNATISNDTLSLFQDITFNFPSDILDRYSNISLFYNSNSSQKTVQTTIQPTSGIDTPEDTSNNTDGDHNNTINTSNFFFKGSTFFQNDSTGLYVITFIFMGLIGILSFFSRNTRCTMLLILPGLATKHSRNFIFTIILGILATGPKNNMLYNMNKLLENGACMYKAGIFMTCIKQHEFDLVLKEAKVLHESAMSISRRLLKMVCALNPSACHQGEYPAFKYENSTWQEISTMASSSTDNIKLQVSIVIAQMNNLGGYVEIIRKCLTIISIIWLILDAGRYLRSYYTDSSFDNMYIGNHIKRYWAKKNYKKLTPLRDWEISQGYKIFNRPSFRKKYRVVRNSIATFIFIVFVTIVLIIDYLLAIALKYIKENKSLDIQFKGMNDGRGFKLDSYSTRSCLASPRFTASNVYWTISLLLLAALLSCLIEVVMSRLRAIMCNVFYPDRAEERADYLFYKIFSGRIIRRYNLLMIIRRELERRIKLARFSPLKRLAKCLSRTKIRRKHKIICPGCGVKVKSKKAESVSFMVVEKEVNTKVCKDCESDLSFGKNKIGDLNIYESKERLIESGI